MINLHFWWKRSVTYHDETNKKMRQCVLPRGWKLVWTPLFWIMFLFEFSSFDGWSRCLVAHSFVNCIFWYLLGTIALLLFFSAAQARSQAARQEQCSAVKMPSSPSSRPRQKPPLQLHRNLRPCVRFCMALHATYLRLFIAPCVRLAMALSTTLYDVSLGTMPLNFHTFLSREEEAKRLGRPFGTYRYRYTHPRT